MEEFGSRLRAAREAHGVSLREVAAATKISISALEGLERNDFTRIPGGIFRRAFIRAYALQVGLDPETTVKEFLVEIERVERDNAKVTPHPEVSAEDRDFIERQRRAALVLKIALGVILVIAIAFSVWQARTLWQRAKSQAAATAAAEARKDVLLPAQPGAMPDKASLPAPVLPAASPTRGTSTPAPDTAPAAPLVIELQFTGECWTRITADGKVAFEVVMRSGDRRVVTAQRDVVIDVGSAGAVVWTVNGKSAKSLGPPGQIRHARVTPATIADFVK